MAERAKATIASVLCIVLGWPAGLIGAPQTRRIERVKDGATASGAGGRWALVVGVDSYQTRSIEPLAGAVADARAIRDVLVKYAEFPENQVTLLVSDGAVKPTAGAIMDRLDEIRKAAKPTDLLLFFFAGHGVQVDGQRYLLTYEADISSTGRLKTSSLPASALMQEIESVRVADRVILVDACRNDPTKPNHQRNVADEAFENAFTLQPSSESGVRATFLSASRGQSAYEWTEKQRGFFSYFVEKGLSGEAAQYGKVTVTSLLTYLNEMVPQKVREQKNQLQVPYAKVDGAELVLVRGEKLPAQTASLDKQPAVAPSRTIYGVVKDSLGMPLAGVTVRVAMASVGRGAGDKPPAELNVTTDEDGFFKADGVAPDAAVKVTATKDSYLPRTLLSGAAESGKKLVVFLPRVAGAEPVVPTAVAAVMVPAKLPTQPAPPVVSQTQPVVVKTAAVTPPSAPPATPLPTSTQAGREPAPAVTGSETITVRPPVPPSRPPAEQPAATRPAAPATGVPADPQPVATRPVPPPVRPPASAIAPATTTPAATASSSAPVTPPVTPPVAPPTPASTAPEAAQLSTKPPVRVAAATPAVIPAAATPVAARADELARVAYQTFLAEDFKEAENAAREALQVDPDSALANAVLGNAVAALGANSSDVQMTLGARPFIARALGRDPALPLAHNALALTLMVEGKLGEAVTELQKAIQGDPKLAAARANLAYILRQQKKLDDAAREYREAIRLDPDSAVPYNGLSAVLFSQGKFKDAVKASLDAISRYQLRDRFLGLLYVQLAVAQYQQGRQEQAIEAVGRAKALGVASHETYSTIEKGRRGRKG